MKSSFKNLRRNPAVGVLAMALVLVTLATIIERTGALPLQGQATPSYGSLPVAGTKKSSSSKKVTTQSKSSRAARTATHPAAAASSKAPTWTGNECAGYGSPSDACKAKQRAMLKGDYSCFKDAKCKSSLSFTCSLGKDCSALQIRKWTYTRFFPDCLPKNDEQCLDGADLLSGSRSPAAVQTCMSSILCRELFATFRAGEFTCRRYEPCLNALEALFSSPECSLTDWCRDMKKIDELYTNDWAKCPTIEAPECKEKIGITPYAVDNKISTLLNDECKFDTVCFEDLRAITETLKYNNHKAPQPGCFLWAECKNEFKSSMEWYCRTPGREGECTSAKAVWNYLTVTNKSCVMSGESDRCQADLRNFRR